MTTCHLSNHFMTLCHIVEKSTHFLKGFPNGYFFLDMNENNHQNKTNPLNMSAEYGHIERVFTLFPKSWLH